MHNNVLNLINTVTGKRVTKRCRTWIGKTNGLYFLWCGTLVGKAFKKITENIDAEVAKCL